MKWLFIINIVDNPHGGMFPEKTLSADLKLEIFSVSLFMTFFDKFYMFQMINIEGKENKMYPIFKKWKTGNYNS